tara:strand:+ start:399 stop:1379 length:981 start_codon:yes stop_codon:yes gene_type:complete
MVILNPFLLAGPSQLEAHQKRRIAAYEAEKGDNPHAFEDYFDRITQQWDEDFSDTQASATDFEQLDDIDEGISKRIQSALQSVGILDDNGFIRLTELTMDDMSQAIATIFPSTSEDNTGIQEKLFSMLQALQQNRPIDFETFSPTMFEYHSTKTGQTISEDRSRYIWNTLHQQGIVDEYGALLLSPNSDALTNAINTLSMFSDEEKKRVLGLLNRHPELSYHHYLDQRSSKHSDPLLPNAGAYRPAEAATARATLTKEEYDYIKITAVLEWSMFSISQKTIYKIQKKAVDEKKAIKKKDEAEELKHLAKIEAQGRERNKAKKSKKG